MKRIHCPMQEVKFAPPDSVDALTFEGYGAAFGNTDAYGDVIERGAFKSYIDDTVKGAQPFPAMLSQHGGFGSEDMTPVGVWHSMSEDANGLKVVGQLADTARGRELYTLMKMTPRPAIDSLSIGYIAREFVNGTKATDPKRLLKKIDLMEISLVTFPANRNAIVSSVKSIEEWVSLACIESYLREAGGFSRTEAKAIISKCKALSPRDVVDEKTAELAQAIRNSISQFKGATK